MVYVEVFGEDRVEKIKICGDFFLYPEDRVEYLERALIGLPFTISEEDLCAKVEEVLGDCVLIGATKSDLARVIKKAMVRA